LQTINFNFGDNSMLTTIFDQNQIQLFICKVELGQSYILGLWDAIVDIQQAWCLLRTVQVYL
jgi:hypothetical protein